MRRIFSLTLVATCISLAGRAQMPVLETAVSPRLFILNQGQVRDQSGQPNTSVQFLYSDRLFNLALKPGGFSYELFYVQKTGQGINESDSRQETAIPDFELKSHRVEVSFAGSNRTAVPEGLKPAEARFNFIRAPVSTHQILDVPSYEQIIYRNLYEGIDLVFYAPDDASQTSLRYEFIVHPGADFRKIRFQYQGASHFKLEENGDFRLSTSYGFVSESRPLFFVEGSPIPQNHSFEIRNGIRSFSKLGYDRSKFLVIDPNIIWGTYYGGTSQDEICELVVDSKNRPSIDGHTLSTEHITTAGAYQVDFGGGYFDFFLAQFKTTGKLNWATYFGGTLKEFCFGLAIDPNDNLIVMGNSESQGLATIGAYKDSIYRDNDSILTGDIIIAKFNKSGGLVWSTYYGGGGPENARNAVCDFKGDIYLAGTTGSSEGIALGNAFQTELAGYDDTWVAKFSKDGNPVWSTYYGGEGVDRAHAIGTDNSGYIYIAGTCNSLEAIATPGTHQPAFAGGSADGYVAKMDTAGNFIWGTYYGGPHDDRVRSVDCDAAGNVYMAGFTQSDSGIATPGSHQELWAAGYVDGEPTEDGYMVRFNPDGQRIWGSYFGGVKGEELWGSTVDPDDAAFYIVGGTESDEGISFGNPVQKKKKSPGGDGYFARFNLDGTIVYGSYYGGKGGDQLEDIVIGSDNFAYIAGRNSESLMYATEGVYQTTFWGGASDAMLYKFYSGPDCFDAYEPNELITQAKIVKSSQKSDSLIYGYSGSIAGTTDEDWLKVKVKAAEGNLMVIISELTKNYDLRFYDPTGNLLYEGKNNGKTADTVIANNLTSGTYSMEIAHGSSSFDPNNCYRIQVIRSADPYDQKEPAQAAGSGRAKSLNIYPNPATHILQASLEVKQPCRAAITIVDMLGRDVLLIEQAAVAGMNTLQIPLHQLPAGSYHVVVYAGGVFHSGKFIKQ